MYCAQKIQSKVPNGYLEGLNFPAPILNKLVKLSNQKTTQLEPDDQSSNEFLELYDPPIKYSSSQSAIYLQLIVAEFDDFKTHKKVLANTINSQRPYNKVYNSNLISLINPSSGAWLQAGISDPFFRLTPFEFMAAMCRRNSTYNTSIPTFNSHSTSDNLQNYQCSCDGPTKMIDRFDYHITGCKKDANAIRLHDNVVHTLVTLLRSLLGLSLALKPMYIFSNHEPDDNRRPDILIRNPYGGGEQIIIDVAVTGIDGTTRKYDDKPN